MTTLVAILVAIVCLLSASGGCAFVYERNLRKLTGKRMIVSVVGDLPFVGYLTHRGRHTYIFETCHTLAGPGETAVPIAGRVVIDRPSIAYMQDVVTNVDLPPAPQISKAGSDVSQ